MLPVTSRVWRILRPISRFRYFNETDNPAPKNIPLQATEHPIGAYMNEPDSFKESVIVTDLSLILEHESTWVPIPYAAIDRPMTPEAKVNVRGLSVLLRNGATVQIRLGGTPPFSDAFEFLRFLNRVLADRQGRQGDD
jgi:hypothetical protein